MYSNFDFRIEFNSKLNLQLMISSYVLCLIIVPITLSSVYSSSPKDLSYKQYNKLLYDWSALYIAIRNVSEGDPRVNYMVNFLDVCF